MKRIYYQYLLHYLLPRVVPPLIVTILGLLIFTSIHPSWIIKNDTDRTFLVAEEAQPHELLIQVEPHTEKLLNTPEHSVFYRHCVKKTLIFYEYDLLSTHFFKRYWLKEKYCSFDQKDNTLVVTAIQKQEKNISERFSVHEYKQPLKTDS